MSHRWGTWSAAFVAAVAPPPWSEARRSATSPSYGFTHVVARIGGVKEKGRVTGDKVGVEFLIDHRSLVY